MLFSAFILSLSVAAAATPKPEDVAAYRELVDQDARLATIGYRLAYANASFCKQTERSPGWVIHDIAQYPDAETARAAFGFDQPVAISVVVPGGPADRAGLRTGDGLVSWFGKPFRWGEISVSGKSYARLADVKTAMRETLKLENSITVGVARDEQLSEIMLNPDAVCASDFQIDSARSGKNAGADGYMVSVSIDMARYVPSDDEFGAIVAHELAHNILGHRMRLDDAKVSRGLGRIFGKSKDAILQTEIEADQLSVWLMANAGYDPHAAITFATRCQNDGCLGRFGDGTHLKWKNRIAVMNQEIAALAKMSATNGLRRPPLLKE